MPSIRATASHDGGADSFNLYRDVLPIDPLNPPAALATGLLTCDYTDTTVIDGNTYHYAFAAVRGAELAFSQSVSIYADPLLARLVVALTFDNSLEDSGVAQAMWTWGPVLPVFENDYAIITDPIFLETNTDALNFGSQNFTLEFEVYPTDLTSYRMLYGAKAYTPYTQIGFNGTQLFFSDDAVGIALNCSHTFTVNDWYNIKLSRNGDVLSWRVNDVVEGSINIAGNQINLNRAGAQFLAIPWSPSASFHGRVKKINVYKGIYV